MKTLCASYALRRGNPPDKSNTRKEMSCSTTYADCGKHLCYKDRKDDRLKAELIPQKNRICKTEYKHPDCPSSPFLKRTRRRCEIRIEERPRFGKYRPSVESPFSLHSPNGLFLLFTAAFPLATALRLSNSKSAIPNDGTRIPYPLRTEKKEGESEIWIEERHRFGPQHSKGGLVP